MSPNDDPHPVYVGDIVADRSPGDDPSEEPMLVVSRYVKRADEYDINNDGTTVADVNPAYPPGDRVIGVKYIPAHTMNVGHKREYAFPRSRLEVIHSPHREVNE